MNDAKLGSASVATAAPGSNTPALHILGVRLAQACEHAAQNNEMLHGIASRTFGEQPSAPQPAGVTSAPLFAGTLGTLESDLDRLFAILEASDRAISRLDRLA